MSNENSCGQAQTEACSNEQQPNSYLTAFLGGGFVTLVGLSTASLIGKVVATAMPYVAGAGMFVGLLSIFAVLVLILKSARRKASKEALIQDAYRALAIIGVAGYFLAACVETFMPGGNASAFWTAGTFAAIVFATLFGTSKFLGKLYENGASKN